MAGKHPLIICMIDALAMTASVDSAGSTVAAIVLWNTVYLNRAVEALKRTARRPPGGPARPSVTTCLAYIGLTGDYVRRSDAGIKGARLRALRSLSHYSIIGS